MKRNKFFSKRRLASFVALALSVNTLSVTAWAGNFADLEALIKGTQADSEGVQNVTLYEDYAYKGDSSNNLQEVRTPQTSAITIGTGNNSVGSNVSIDLNGYTITGSVDSIFKVDNGTLTVKDSSTASTPEETDPAPEETDSAEPGDSSAGGALKTGQNNLGSIVIVKNGGTFNMEGGTITGGVSKGGHTGHGGEGGAVHVDKESTFNMSGGTITGNKNIGNASYGGGVYVAGTFNMTGGTITKNTSKYGSGVYVAGDGKFNMSGGNVTGNISDNEAVANIDGVKKDHIAVTGGTIATANEQYMKDNCKELTIRNEDAGTTTVVGHDWENVDKVDATCGESGHEAGKTCEACGKKEGQTTIAATGEHNWIPATCENPQTCKICDAKGEAAKGHVEVADTDRNKPATCGKPGWEGATKCSVCGDPQDAGTEIPATGDHSFGESGNWSDWVTNAEGTEQTRTGTHTCVVCGKLEPVSETVPVNPGDGEDNGSGDDNTENPGDNTGTGDTENPEEPTPEEPAPGETEPPVTPGDVTVIPDDETPLAADPTAAPAAAADTTVITDDPIPLAGLITKAQLLAELYRYEQRPEVVLPEEFDFAEHEYALAICWGLDNALETHSEDDPYLPDDLLTVSALREVLVNFVAYKGIEDLEFTVEGEDDELVMDLDVRLAAFYELLEAAEA